MVYIAHLCPVHNVVLYNWLQALCGDHTHGSFPFRRKLGSNSARKFISGPTRSLAWAAVWLSLGEPLDSLNSFKKSILPLVTGCQ